MDFPQQIEEALVERPPSAYDVVMESPLYLVAGMEAKLSTDSGAHLDKMNSSLNSTLDDTTPSDSGVQMLDSESSEMMIESITSQTCLDFEDGRSAVALTAAREPSIIAATVQVDTNSNVTNVAELTGTVVATAEDVMTTSGCSTFDTTEQIVYRRKTRKPASGATKAAAPKKRVSFHEDILKNTRTDNIHIEHGFITYKRGRKMMPQVGTAGRYSWCSEGDQGGIRHTAPTEICAQTEDEMAGRNGGRGDGGGTGERKGRHIVYRNACSDVLDYGNSDIYDTNEANCLRYDNSGVFEYQAQNNGVDNVANAARVNPDGQVLYRCSCSSSNSSLDSEESDKNSNRQQYGQAKSSSCDCIGMSNANNNIIGDNCYFSEPNMESVHESSPPPKSVWNKEKKPKSSCLKKNRRHTNIIHEHDLNTKMKKFNVHDMNQLLDNSSKMIFGSLKSIFTMPLPERGVPEGSEDLQAVVECTPELEQTPEHKAKEPQVAAYEYNAVSPTALKQKPFLSKSLDGSKQQQSAKQFIHNVDEQLRRKNDGELYTPTRQSSAEQNAHEQLQQQQHQQQQRPLQRQQEFEVELADQDVLRPPQPQEQVAQPLHQFRNKFIINCESTVFEHTGVSYETSGVDSGAGSLMTLMGDRETPIAQPEPDQLRSTFMSATPIAKTFSSFFRSIKESATSPGSAVASKRIAAEPPRPKQEPCQDQQPTVEMLKKTQGSVNDDDDAKHLLTPSSSGVSELSSDSLPSTVTASAKNSSSSTHSPLSNSLHIGHDLRSTLDRQSRHLASPLRRRSNGAGGLMMMQPARYGCAGGNVPDHSLLSPDLFNGVDSVGGGGARGGCGRDSKSTILSEEYDDILTITTDTDKNESDIVIVDYPELSDRSSSSAPGMTQIASNLLKPPAAKTSLINRFLRNVTQKKILEASIRKNDFFSDKLRNEQKLFAGNLYVRGAKPKNYDLIEDLNAEIAMEIEMSGANSPRRELANIDSDLPGDMARFELGIGEISIDIFNGNYLHILRDSSEQLLKVFKLYTGYTREGYMTPVLVFLTDKTLYVTDLVRNRLCSKFALAYTDLDVILMGPYGNTVLLSNSDRDMQQVLLAGGPYPADGLVANLELCARRSGSILPAVGQLTLGHLAPLQAFVREHSCVDKDDAWMYYAVVNVPAGALGSCEQEPLGPHIKGFLMQRRIRDFHVGANYREQWNPGYFLLKAGVLYMFNDSGQKLPSWAMALAECQGARRAVKAGRPHCFEIMLQGGELLQLAAPDEYVASEWLQALLQSASGLFEMQEKHKTLGCTLVVTQNHLITLREDFTGPLRQLSKPAITSATHVTASAATQRDHDETATLDSGSMLSSAVSTPSRGTQRSCSSLGSTPTRLSQLSSRSSVATGNTITSTSQALTASLQQTRRPIAGGRIGLRDICSNMSSVYGKNSGLEILTCADIKEMTGIKIPSHNDTWWCILEFSCQEVRESSDDLVIFFASSSEMQRFLRLLETLWQAKNNDLFPITILDEDDAIAEQCTMLYMDINRSWEPLLSAALGYPL